MGRKRKTKQKGGASPPAGTTGTQLDVLARQFLWNEGLDYDHGTGHGVGAFLSVHEGPQRISKMPNAVALRFHESTDLLNLHHKLRMRLCYNAQEEIWRASRDEAEQV